ncbi:MAG: glycosyltransferase family 2 protein [Pseudomonadota bacterium]
MGSNQPKTARDPGPRVSVIMAFHNGATYLRDAILSILAQTHENLELILSDDGSTDCSLAIARDAAAQDDRVCVLNNPVRSGPAAARNRALSVASGDWVAIVDADDLIHPARIERMLLQADRLKADLLADDLIYFGAESGRSLLRPLALSSPWFPEAADILAAETRIDPVALGYLKPIIRRDVLGTTRYRQTLQVGEDFDLLLRLVLAGARFAVIPHAYYLYRRHAQSISHRLSEDAARQMVVGLTTIETEWPDLTAEIRNMLRRRRDALEKAARFAALSSALKARKFGAALGYLMRHPALAVALVGAMREHSARPTPISPIDGQTLTLGADTGASIELSGTIASVPSHAAIAIAKSANTGSANIRAVGLAGLEALGYVPGWAMAELTPPKTGWSAADAARIKRLPWPTKTTVS